MKFFETNKKTVILKKHQMKSRTKRSFHFFKNIDAFDALKPYSRSHFFSQDLTPNPVESSLACSVL